MLAMPMMASRAPGRVGHSNRLYSTCKQAQKYQVTDGAARQLAFNHMARAA